MKTIEERLDILEGKMREESFRRNTGLGNEVGYYVFDYEPQQELVVRKRILSLYQTNTSLKYGYQLIAELKDRGGPLFGLKEGTLYPILYRLEDEGLIESRWVEGENRQTPRKYYLMTDKGRTALNEIYQVWRQITDGVERLMGQEE